MHVFISNRSSCCKHQRKRYTEVRLKYKTIKAHILKNGASTVVRLVELPCWITESYTAEPVQVPALLGILLMVNALVRQKDLESCQSVYSPSFLALPGQGTLVDIQRDNQWTCHLCSCVSLSIFLYLCL